jgi:hypothetical protein
MAFMSKYGVARHIYIPIVKRGVVDFAVGADWTPAAGDVKISKDGGAAANVTNLPTAIAMGNAAIWDFSITATEMQAAQVVITVADSATKAVEDQAIEIETYGNASAQSEFDLDTPTVNPGAAGITSASFAANAIDSNALATSAAQEIRDAVVAFLTGRQNTATAGAAGSITLDAGASTVVDFYVGHDVTIIGGTGLGQTRLITAYSAGRVATVGENWATNPDATSVFVLTPNRAMVSKMLTDVLDANALKADAVTEIQSGLATAASIAAVQADTDNIQTRLPAALVGGRRDSDVGNMQANTLNSSALATSAVTEIQTGLASAAQATAIQADTDDIQTRLPAALVGGRMDSSVGAMANDVLTAAALAASAATEIANAVAGLTSAELAAVPGAGGTLQQKLDYVFEMMRHRITQTGVLQTIFKDDGVTPLGTGAVSDDGVTFTRGEIT